MSEKDWEIPNITSVPAFLRALLKHVSSTVTVSFEIYRAPAEVSLVYLQHRSNANYQPWRDTISPRTRVFFCDLNRPFISELNRLLKTHEPYKVFWHIKGFVDGYLFFYIHDADMGKSVLLSPRISNAAVRAIALSVKRVPERVDSYINWDANWSDSPQPKKRRKPTKVHSTS
jgi:hypothetical protein